MKQTTESLQIELEKLKEKYTALEIKHQEETEKIQKENDALKYKLMFLEGVANSPYDGFLVVDPKGQKILQNQRTADLWEIPKEVVEDPDGMKQVMHVMNMTVDPQKFVSEIDYLREHPDAKSLDELELTNGTILERYSAPVIGADNENYGRIWTFHDITERKEIEKQLIQLNADKDRFLSILAHDLRSPFNSLMGFSELLMKNIENYPLEKTRVMLEAIHKTSKNTFDLLEDTLLWTNVKSKKLTFQPDILTIHEVIHDVIDFLNDSALSKNITLENNADTNTNVFADVYMIKAILRNLISNALKFTDKGGKVSISARKEGDQVKFSVTDNGIGIAPDRIDDLFKFSAKKSTKGTNNEEGTGLGLMLCKEFIEKHNGETWVESQLGKGTHVFFTLPSTL